MFIRNRSVLIFFKIRLVNAKNVFWSHFNVLYHTECLEHEDTIENTFMRLQMYWQLSQFSNCEYSTWKNVNIQCDSTYVLISYCNIIE